MEYRRIQFWSTGEFSARVQEDPLLSTGESTAGVQEDPPLE